MEVRLSCGAAPGDLIIKNKAEVTSVSAHAGGHCQSEGRRAGEREEGAGRR